MPDGDSEMPVESGETSVMTNRKPRIYLHPDHEHISIGFDDTQDTLLAMPVSRYPNKAGRGPRKNSRPALTS